MQLVHPEIDIPMAWMRAYRLADTDLSIVPAWAERDWMSSTRDRFAYRCLPLRIANQAGWFILNTQIVRVIWDGGSEQSSTRIHVGDAATSGSVVSHFGHGIITWHIPYLFRTPRGVNLRVRGPTNFCKDGIAPLDGIVETDWAVATFTMNWKITRPDHEISFAPGEPICMIVPEIRGLLERFEPEVKALDSDPELLESHQRWAASRGEFLAALKNPSSEATAARWEKHYFKGTSPDGSDAAEHQTKVQLKPFRDEWTQSPHPRQLDSDPTPAGQEPQPQIAERSGDPAIAVIEGTRNNIDITDEALLSPTHVVVDDFLAFATSMRDEFEAHFSQPHLRCGERQQIWDYWCVPDMYTYLRTDPTRVLSRDLVEAFLSHLTAWSIQNLGLAKVSRPYLSLYINGCHQGFHNDSENGRLAYVFSLTDWDTRRFTGGETILLKDQPYWGSPRITNSGAGTDFYHLVPPLFNRLLVFDDRVIHGVRQLQGGMDPRECRVVLHGHITEGGIVAEGALTSEQVSAGISDACTSLLDDLPSPESYQGFFTVRLQVEPNGKIASTEVLCNRVVAISSDVKEPSTLVSVIAERLSLVTFPAQSEGSNITLPVMLHRPE